MKWPTVMSRGQDNDAVFMRWEDSLDDEATAVFNELDPMLWVDIYASGDPGKMFEALPEVIALRNSQKVRAAMGVSKQDTSK